MDLIEKLLKDGIESFLNNRFDKASMYFCVVLSKDVNNDIARFGVMCIDAIEDGIIEAKDMFSIYIFSPDEQKEYIREALESYKGNDVFDGAVSSYIEEILNNQDYDNAFISKKAIVPSQYNDPDLYGEDFIMGKIYEKLGNYDKAIDYIAKAYKTKPFDDNLKRELLQIVRRRNAKQ